MERRICFEIAEDLLADLDEDESDAVSEADVHLRLARLWRLTLVRFNLEA